MSFSTGNGTNDDSAQPQPQQQQSGADQRQMQAEQRGNDRRADPPIEDWQRTFASPN